MEVFTGPHPRNEHLHPPPLVAYIGRAASAHIQVHLCTGVIKMGSDGGFTCELNFSLHANCEMVIDHISEEDIIDTIVNGSRTPNAQGPGDIFTLGTVHVVSDGRPCHHLIITAYRSKRDGQGHKDKPYRRRRYLRRGRKSMQCPRCDKAELRRGRQTLSISGEDTHYEGYQCPNCLLTFFDEGSSRDIRAVIEEMDATPLTAEDMSLLLLVSTDRPVRGAISFMKELFLMLNEVLPRFELPVIPPNFIPYHYGPYSFDIIDAWNNIEERGLVLRTGRRSTNKESFELTTEGRKAGRALFQELPGELQEFLPGWRRGLDELGNDGILKLVYSKYPSFTDKSKIRDEVLPRGMRRRA